MKLLLSTLRQILTILVFCATTFQVAAAEPTEAQTAALKSYYNACMEQLNSPEVLKMCDTLTMRAKAVGSGHFIVLAKMIHLEHYYFQNDKDKVPEYVEAVKRLCKEYNESEYYYFVWGSRLITFYLRNGMMNHALLEAQNMLREAQAEDYQKGIIECYKAMGNIYSMQSNSQLAAEYYEKAVTLAEKYNPEDVNIPIYYSSLSESEIQAGHLDKAEKALDKIEEYFEKTDTVTPYQRLSINRGRLKLTLIQRDMEGAKKAYEQIEELFKNNKLSIHRTALYQARMSYYTNTNQYDKALVIIDSIRQTGPSSEMLTYLLSHKGDICWKMNDRASAAEYYRDYISLTDSIRQVSSQNSANEIAGLLNLQQLEKEKQQLQVDIQRRRLNTTYWALALLGVVLTAGAVFLFRLFKMNRQLKENKQYILHQNTELEKAKQKAEQVSEMKSRFIQDISHEVRTPLNAIVGFSRVVGDLCNQPETQEYAAIIENNSDDLLRLFDDVLELSRLDELDNLPYNTTTDIHTNCHSAIDQIRPFIKQEVELRYCSSEEKLQVITNPAYVTRVLTSILHNAVKFTQSGCITLECTVSRNANTIQYSVTDTGPGIPSEMHNLIFERFRKVDTFSQGSGLGLAVCRAIATKLGGTLEIDKHYTQGCRFVLTLPLLFP